MGFRWAIEAKKQRGAKLIVVDPRFNPHRRRGRPIHCRSAPARTLGFLGGIINWLINNDKIHWDYVKAYTNASLIVKEEGRIRRGLVLGFDAEKNKYDRASWNYELDANGCQA